MKLIYFLTVLLLPCLLIAQAPEKNNEAEQIVITKKGTDAQKLNIVIDGDRVTINGQEVNEKEKDAAITVKRRKIKDLNVWSDDSGLGSNALARRYGSVWPQTLQMPNKAMLGVITQRADKGVEVITSTENSAAAIAGIRTGDIIVEVERQKITTPNDLSAIIRDKNPGDKVTIAYLRNNKQHTAVAELKKWEAPSVEQVEGLDLPALPDFNPDEFRINADQFRVPGSEQWRAFTIPQGNTQKLGIKVQDVETGNGVKVIEVEPGSNAEKAGIKQGDVITQADGQAVNSTDVIRLKVLRAKTKQTIMLGLERNGKPITIEVKMPRKIKTADL